MSRRGTWTPDLKIKRFWSGTKNFRRFWSKMEIAWTFFLKKTCFWNYQKTWNLALCQILLLFHIAVCGSHLTNYCLCCLFNEDQINIDSAVFSAQGTKGSQLINQLQRSPFDRTCLRMSIFALTKSCHSFPKSCSSTYINLYFMPASKAG